MAFSRCSGHPPPTRTTLNVQSEMGVIFLVGIVVSQGVLLLDFANQLRRQGRTVQEAITQAAAIRTTSDGVSVNTSARASSPGTTSVNGRR